MRFMGIDAGKSGGIAILDWEGAVIELFKFQDATDADIHEFIRWNYGNNIGHCVVMLENVGSFNCRGQTAGMILKRMPLVRMHGVIWGILIGMNMTREEVTPKDWQKAIGCLTKGDKKISYRKAQELFPRTKVTHWNADALLIAEHNRRTYRQRNGV